MITSISQSKKIITKGWTFFRYCFQSAIVSLAGGYIECRETPSGVNVGSKRAENECRALDFVFALLACSGDEACGCSAGFFTPLQLYHIGLEWNRQQYSQIDKGKCS